MAISMILTHILCSKLSDSQSNTQFGLYYLAKIVDYCEAIVRYDKNGVVQFHNVESERYVQ